MTAAELNGGSQTGDTGDDGELEARAPPSLTPASLRRLRKRWQFLACAQGRSLARGAVVVQALARSDSDPAIGAGFTATKKIGGAVVRNRAKRRLREAARQLLPLHGSPSYDYVFVARAGAAERAWLRLLDDMKSALSGLAAGGGEPPRPGRSKFSGRPKARTGKKSPDG